MKNKRFKNKHEESVYVATQCMRRKMKTWDKVASIVMDLIPKYYEKNSQGIVIPKRLE